MEFSSRIFRLKRSKFRGIFNGICVVVFLCMFANQEHVRNQFSKKPFSNLFENVDSNDGFLESSVSRRKAYENAYDLPDESVGKNRELGTMALLARRDPTICSDVYLHKDYSSKCAYLRDNPQCNSGGFFNYIEFFYCDCVKYPALGYVVLVIWLLALFYLLGNTASDFFCCSLEMLSNLLKLPPTVAGVTLLPLGNGAPDVFSSIASFVGRDSGNIGLNSVLGGAVFVVCIVVGTVSFCVAGQTVRIDKKCFIRDVCFFLAALVALLAILVVGKVTVGGAVAFVSIYVFYAMCIAAREILRQHGWRLRLNLRLLCTESLLPVTGSGETPEDECIRTSLLQSNSEDSVSYLKPQLPHQLWTSNVAIYSNGTVKATNDENPKNSCGWNEENTANEQSSFSWSGLCLLLEIPLTVPRRLTIPIVEEERWSKVYAVTSAVLAPLLLVFLWGTQYGSGSALRVVVYVIGAVVGGILGLLTLLHTESNHPPRRFLLPWVLGGFLMSIVWFYIIANELVALLVAFGTILGIKSSLLALTILAWGNSLGDLMANVAIAMNGGHGVQVAISGCFAGPMFNTLVGLGVSLLLGAWSQKPSSYIIPSDASLYFTLGFLVLGLVWSLVVLPKQDMRPGKLLGTGLMIIYLCFLTLRISMAISDGSVNGTS